MIEKRLSCDKEHVHMDRVVAFTDGTAEPNPGPAAIGVVIKNRQDRVVTTISQSIGRATNNQAEYRAIIAALETALRLGATHIHVRSDSELVVRQIEGNYRVKSAALKSLHQQVRQLIARCQARLLTFHGSRTSKPIG